MNININFTAWPEMLAWPYLMLQGWLPYRDITIAHNPLLLFDLVIFYKLFGVGIIQLKIFTWLLIFFNTFLTFYVAKKCWNRKTAFLSVISYLLLVIVYEGNGLWFDLALTPFALLLYSFIREKKYLYAGIVFALGFLTKQTFIYFLIPVVIRMIHDSRFKIQEMKNFIFGNLVIILPFLIILYLFGILDDYYNFAIKFGIFYLPSASGQIHLPTVKQFVFGFLPFIVLIFNFEFLIFNFALFGALGVYSRFELFHFQPALPFLAIVFATFFYSKYKKIIKVIIAVLAFIFLASGIHRQIGGVTRFYESDVLKVVNEINRTNSKTIYVVNYWDNIYALTNTIPSVKPLIPYIPWYLDYQNNKEIILSSLKIKFPYVIVVKDRNKLNWEKIQVFIERFYNCSLVENNVEVCLSNKI